jgi:DNA mismatch endonuclease (patch repair protein)
VERDRSEKLKLEQQGWKVITVWECETRSNEALKTFLLDRITRL